MSMVLAGFNPGDWNLVPVSEEDIDYGEPLVRPWDDAFCGLDMPRRVPAEWVVAAPRANSTPIR